MSVTLQQFETMNWPDRHAYMNEIGGIGSLWRCSRKQSITEGGEGFKLPGVSAKKTEAQTDGGLLAEEE